MAGSEDVYLQIKPIGIEALSATKETHTEKFCFFFLARELSFVVEYQSSSNNGDFNSYQSNFLLHRT